MTNIRAYIASNMLVYYDFQNICATVLVNVVMNVIVIVKVPVKLKISYLLLKYCSVFVNSLPMWLFLKFMCLHNIQLKSDKRMLDVLGGATPPLQLSAASTISKSVFIHPIKSQGKTSHTHRFSNLKLRFTLKCARIWK